MPSLRNYSLGLSEEDYHNLPAWSYSIIARYAKEGFPALATLHRRVEPTPAMKFGSLFDSLLTGGKTAKDRYVVCDIAVPESEKKMLDTLATITGFVPFHLIDDDEIKKAQELSGYQTRWGIPAVRNHIGKYLPYYEAVSSGKEIVSRDDWNDANYMADRIHEDGYLKDIFGTKDTKNVEYLYQLQFLRTMCIDDGSGLCADVKIMPDLLKVDHAYRTTQPVDLKSSTMPGYQFADQFVRMRYDLQASVYVDVLQEVLNSIPEYRDYTILPYLFTDISRTDKIPVTYEYDPRSESQMNGFSFGDERQYTFKGWKQLLSEIISYESAEAVVPSYITTAGPNNLIEVLNYKR